MNPESTLRAMTVAAVALTAVPYGCSRALHDASRGTPAQSGGAGGEVSGGGAARAGASAVFGAGMPGAWGDGAPDSIGGFAAEYDGSDHGSYGDGQPIGDGAYADGAANLHADGVPSLGDGAVLGLGGTVGVTHSDGVAMQGDGTGWTDVYGDGVSWHTGGAGGFDGATSGDGASWHSDGAPKDPGPPQMDGAQWTSDGAPAPWVDGCGTECASVPAGYPWDARYLNAPLPDELADVCAGAPIDRIQSDSDELWRSLLEGQWLLCPGTRPADSPLPADVVGIAFLAEGFVAFVLDADGTVVRGTGIDYTGSWAYEGRLSVQGDGATSGSTSTVVLAVDPYQLRTENLGRLVRP
jgi:hypothetical protein